MNSDQLEELKDQLTIELTNTLNAQMGAKNQEIDDELSRIRQVLQRVNSPEQRGVEDGTDIILNQHMRDITRENRPQMSSAGLSMNNKHFRDLSNHELHKIKKMHEKDHSLKPKTILDESLGDIMNKLVNFLTFSFDGYTKAYYAAEVMENVYDDEKNMYQRIKVHLIAIILFMREDQNILYIGILLVFLSMIIYLVNITTS
ncbi:MAG: hypothetical protein CMK44_01105 [Porticoccus sp.]|nr:hypothetical protein [Porticoccus sp.]